jgi:hypothetical protein
MKLPLPPIVVFLLSPATAANNSRRHHRTLSASTKKPASLAGFLYLRLSMTRLTALFLRASSRTLPAARASYSPRSLHSTIQTPSSL